MINSRRCADCVEDSAPFEPLHVKAQPVSAGPYLVYDAFASGGMGTIHFGAAIDGTRVVAIKRLHPHLRKDAAFADLILDEARLAMSVRHPNVVSVIDVVSTDEELLLVMEYVPGLSLYELIRLDPDAPLPIDVAVPIAIDALCGLQAAHDAVGPDGRRLNLVHRDVSPHNLLVGTDGRTKLTDFGVAKAVGRLRSTRDGSLKGKIPYMSPEQLGTQPLDARSDVYATAVVLWEMLTGRQMFDADTDVALIGKAMRGATVRAADVVPNLPHALDAALWRALSRNPGRRYPTAIAFADALVAAVGPGDRGSVASWLSGRGHTELESREQIVKRMRRTGSAVESSPALTADSTGTTSAHRSFPLALVAAALFGVTALGVAFSFSLSRSARPAEELHDPPEPVATTTPAAPTVATEPTDRAVPSTAAEPKAAPAMASADSPRRRSSAPAIRQGTATGRTADPKRVCDPPYSIDTNGDKHFKPECLR